MANLFKWWVKFKEVDRKKKKKWVTDVIILTWSLNPSSAEICAKSKKKKDLLRNALLPVLNVTLWKDKLFFTRTYVNVRYRFFRKIFQTASGSLKCAGSLNDPRVSGSPSLS